MNNSATLGIRLNPEIKRGASEIVEGLGLDLSSVIRAFTTQIYLRRSIPLDLSYPETYTPNEASMKSIAEANKFFNSKKKTGFKSVDDMFSSMDI
jgi:addiction module RelB/DinJ family antitoxin